MFNKKIVIILFALAAIIQLSVIAYTTYDKESLLSNGIEIKMKLAPVDPVDPFRGRYVSLNFDNTTIEVKNKKDWTPSEICYAILEKDDDGYYQLANISKTEPSNEKVFVKSYITFSGNKDDNNISIRYPFSRYYMEESKAIKVEKIMNELDHDSSNSYIILKYKEGEVIVKNLIIEKKKN